MTVPSGNSAVPTDHLGQADAIEGTGTLGERSLDPLGTSSDLLSLTNAIEDAGIERLKAARIATVIFDAMHQSVATKADVQACEASLRKEMRTGSASLRAQMHHEFVAVEQLRSTVQAMGNRVTLRLGSIVAAGVAIIVGAQLFLK